MKKFLNYLKESLWAVWLSGSVTAITGLNLFNIKFWAILLPTIILNVIFNNKNK